MIGLATYDDIQELNAKIERLQQDFDDLVAELNQATGDAAAPAEVEEPAQKGPKLFKRNK